MDTKSGELISGAIAVTVSLSAITAPVESVIFGVLARYHAMPEWAIIAAICGIFCMVASFVRGCRTQAAARMMSGCVWGSLLLVLGVEGKLLPLFWIALVLFLFDIYVVTIKGQVWRGKSNS